jgi:hypothetical protein
MSRGESYDQASRNSLPTSGMTDRAQQVAAQMATGASYDRASQAAASADPGQTESPGVVTARWTRHLGAMQAGGAHEAGWAASTQD